MRRREGDGCPVAGALQVVGDKWTLLVVRELVRGARRTSELLTSLHPISSRTLVGRLRDMERDSLIERRKVASNPPGVEYVLTARGRHLLPLLDALRETGLALDCNECNDRLQRLGSYCAACPHAARPAAAPDQQHQPTRPARRDRPEDSIVLL